MAQAEWLDMLTYLEELHCFSRSLLTKGRSCPLTASELELLSLLYLHPEERTPLALSRRSGMKKEAVSRCLRQLVEEDCVAREKNPRDERSYELSLTEAGHQALEQSYGILLRPLYQLKRRMGGDFQTLFTLIEEGNRRMAETEEEM